MSNLFDQIFELFMERFPKLALSMESFSSSHSKEEKVFPSNLEEVDLVYIYGLGSAASYPHFKDWLLENKARKLIFLEEDLKEISAFLKGPNAQEVLENPQVILEKISKGKTLHLELEELTNRFPFSKIEVFSLASKSSKKFEALRASLLKNAALSSAIYLDRLYGFQPFENFLSNLKFLPDSFYANRMKGSFKNIPAIICGAGPSLQDTIFDLKKLEEKALIIAGGSGIAALSSSGILPHFGMALDPNLEEYRRFKNSFAFEMPLLYSTRLFPKTFQTLNGPFGYMHSGVGGILELWIDEELKLKEPCIGRDLSMESMSVTTMCISFAKYLGCNPIFLNGVDLAYTDGKRYAQGVGDSMDLSLLEKEKDAQDRLFQKKNLLGEDITTATRWLMEAKSLSNFARKYRKTKMYNLTNKGLEIPGVPFLSLTDAILKFMNEPQNIAQRVHEQILLAKMPQNTKEIIDTKIEELITSLKRVVEYLEVLSGEKTGSKALCEYELEQECAYDYLFYDTKFLIQKTYKEEEMWKIFLEIAKKYRLTLSRKNAIFVEFISKSSDADSKR